MAILIVLSIAVVAIGIGIYVGSLGNTNSVDPGANGRAEGCADACSQWQTRKAELCDAERAEADAKEHVDLMKDLLLAVSAGTVSVVVALLGAATLVATLSKLGVPAVVAGALLAGGIAIAALGATVSLALLAALLTATIIWSNKKQATNDAESAETEARVILNNACTEDEIASCLANAPC